MENKEVVYIASFSDFPLIADNIMCIGVCRDFPDEFKTTTIRNFLYTPNSILAIGDVSGIDYNLSELKNEYVEHVRNSIPKLGFHSLREYFGKMLSSMCTLNDGSIKNVCFLGVNVDDEKDSTAFIKHLLQTLGYRVVNYKQRNLKVQESENIGLF